MSGDSKDGFDLTSIFGAPKTSNQLGSFDLFGRPKVSGLYYSGKQLTLDGYTFVGCRFDGCTLIVNSTNFELIECVIDPATTVIYGTSILKILKLFLGRYDWAYVQDQFAGFVPIRHANGSITISDN